MPENLNFKKIEIFNNESATTETLWCKDESARNSIAPEFNSSSTYTSGSYVYYNNILYRFTTNHTAGAWNSSQVTAVTVGSDIDTRVLKTGDEMTGSLSIKNLVDDIDARPDSTIYYSNISFKDKSNKTVGMARAVHKAEDGIALLQISCLRPINGSTSNNEMQLRVAEDGTQTVWVSNQAAWRNGLGASNGIWPISLGGTGLTTSPSMLVNLSSTTATSIFTATPRPGITGTLSVANGGTGKITNTNNAILVGNGSDTIKNVATKAGAFFATATDGAAQFNTLPVAYGGTGRTSNTNNAIITGGNGTNDLKNVTTKAGAFFARDTNGQAEFDILPTEYGGTGGTYSEGTATNRYNTTSKVNNFTGTITVRKIGRICTITCYQGKLNYKDKDGNDLTLNPGSNIVIADIEEAFRPKNTATGYAGSAAGIGQIIVYSGGEIRFNPVFVIPPAGGTTYERQQWTNAYNINFTFTYLVNG